LSEVVSSCVTKIGTRNAEADLQLNPEIFFV